MTEQESRPRYVGLGGNIGAVHLQMRDNSFYCVSAMWMSTNQNSDIMYQEDAVFWYERACKLGAVFL